jgi:antirestriction protein ArdC
MPFRSEGGRVTDISSAREPDIVRLSPYNAVTRHEYTRGNVFILTGAAKTRGFMIPAWVTAKEVEKLGGRIRDGEPGQCIHYSHRPGRKLPSDTEDEDAEPSFRKEFVVYNLEQCDFSGTDHYAHLGELRTAFRHFAELSDRERDFLKSLSQRPYPLSPKQRRWLDDILGRLSR